ncbi:MAG TPA: uroporphyrinogen-III synthase [Nitrospiraceae bacterium]|nr:uroporphyrinogen-III synthase [Nitrospiraceae bacterium]
MNPFSFAGLRVAAFESRMAEEMQRLIERYGGQPLVAPSMQEVRLQDNSEVLQFGERLFAGHVDMVILLTGVGARVMLDVLGTRYSLEQITSALTRTTLVVRGPKPKAVLREVGPSSTIEVPEPNTWRDILHTLDGEKPVNGLRIAVQEYGVINAELIEGLHERGAQVTRVPVYRWTLPDDLAPFQNVLDEILEERVDVLLITNAVQIDHAWQVLDLTSRQDRFRRSLSNLVVASIGPTATERLRSYGFPVDLEPSHPKMGILVKESAERAGDILRRKRAALT